MCTNFGKNGKDELIILLLHFTQLQLEHQVLELSEEIIQIFESFLGEEKSSHSLANRSLGHLSYQTRKQDYPKPPWESSIH